MPPLQNSMHIGKYVKQNGAVRHCLRLLQSVLRLNSSAIMEFIILCNEFGDLRFDNLMLEYQIASHAVSIVPCCIQYTYVTTGVTHTNTRCTMGPAH